LEENEIQARTLGLNEFSETQSNLVFETDFNRLRQKPLRFEVHVRNRLGAKLPPACFSLICSKLVNFQAVYSFIHPNK
jgi:hypothetical protein